MTRCITCAPVQRMKVGGGWARRIAAYQSVLEKE